MWLKNQSLIFLKSVLSQFRCLCLAWFLPIIGGQQWGLQSSDCPLKLWPEDGLCLSFEFSYSRSGIKEGTYTDRVTCSLSIQLAAPWVRLLEPRGPLAAPSQPYASVLSMRLCLHPPCAHSPEINLSQGRTTLTGRKRDGIFYFRQEHQTGPHLWQGLHQGYRWFSATSRGRTPWSRSTPRVLAGMSSYRLSPEQPFLQGTRCGHGGAPGTTKHCFYLNCML